MLQRSHKFLQGQFSNRYIGLLIAANSQANMYFSFCFKWSVARIKGDMDVG